MSKTKANKVVDRFEISVSIPLIGKTKDERIVELMEKLGRIEDEIASVGATYEICPHSSNEQR